MKIWCRVMQIASLPAEIEKLKERMIAWEHLMEIRTGANAAIERRVLPMDEHQHVVSGRPKK